MPRWVPVFAFLLLGAGTARADELPDFQAVGQRLQRATREGVWGLVPLLVTATALAAFALSRRRRYRRKRLFPGPLRSELTHVVFGQRPRREYLANLAAAHASLLSNVVRAVLHTAHCSVLERSDLAQKKIETECGELKRGNGYFDVFYSTATLLGLLGALFGLIDAFSRQAEHPDGIGNAAVTAAVAPALTASAAGAFLAVAARILGAYFQSLHEKRKRELEGYIQALVLHLEAPIPEPGRQGHNGETNGLHMETRLPVERNAAARGEHR
jgi:biopolymer transport protein ExbB/TolQ